MAEKDNVFEGKVRQVHIFSYSDLYSFTYRWLVDAGYKVDEKAYSEKVGPGGKDIEITWEAKKKVSDYFKFIIKSQWRIIGMNSVEVEENGKKKKMEKGQVEIKIGAVIEKDYEHRWEGNAFLKFLRGVYEKFVIKSRIEQYEGKLFGEADEFIAQIKSFLALEGMH